MRTINIAAALIISGLGIVMHDDAHAGTYNPDAVVYCETNPVVVDGWERWVTTIDRADGRDNYRVVNMTLSNTPVTGRRHLVESPVTHGPRVMDCRVRFVNGVRSVVLTTVGGAEWTIARPVLR